jgi:transcription elongation GreA/GreB family factor
MPENLKIVDYSPQQEGKVFFGAWVEIENDDGDTCAFALSATMKFLAAKTTSPSTRRWRARC